jgi:alkylation response protein AidB-like acyl-CoA dehydrogenase
MLTKVQPPSPEELISRAAALVPLLRGNARQAEQLRRVPDENIDALEDAGLLRMGRPAHRGGFGIDPPTLATVLTSIASGCPATAWVAMIYNSVSHLAELLPEPALQEIYDGENVRVSAVFGKTGALLDPVDGGYRVRGGGSWPFNSGCYHAAWDLLRVDLAKPDGSTEPAFIVLPMSDLTIVDDWHVMGATGTGSNTVTCGEVFVPAHRVAPLMAVPVREAIPADLNMGQTVALALGMARFAVDAFMDMATTNAMSTLGYQRVADSPLVHSAVSQASVKIKLIEAFQHWVLSGRDTGDQQLLMATSTGCFRLAREAIEVLSEASPSFTIGLDYPVQRLLRDAHAFEHQHAFSSFIGHQLYGRIACHQ